MNYVTAEDFRKALDKAGSLTVTTDYNRLDWNTPFVPSHVLSRFSKVKKVRGSVFEVRKEG